MRDYETIGGKGEWGVVYQGRLVGVVREVSSGTGAARITALHSIGNYGPKRPETTLEGAFEGIVRDAKAAIAGSQEAK
jgi:hypothetical protein